MGLKLKSTGGTGSVQLNCPDNHNLNTSFTLPTTNVTGGEFVLADGSGNVNIDSGTLYVDAVNNRVGVGTSSPSVELSIAGSDPQLVLWEGADGASSSKVQLGTGTVQGFINIHKGDGTRTVQLNSDGDSYFTGGNVGIGTTNPTRLLTVQSTGNANFCIKSSTTGTSQCMFGDTDSDVAGNIAYSHSNNSMAFEVNGSTAATIDSSGRLLVGTSTSKNADDLIQAYKSSGQLGIWVESASLANGEYCLTRNRGNTSGGGTRQAWIGVYKHSAIVSPGPHIFLGTENGINRYYWTDNSNNFRSSNTVTHIGTTSGTVVGTQTSDERLKNVGENVTYGLTEVLQLQPKQYALKTEPDTNKLGFIAQEVESIIPEAVFDAGEELEGHQEGDRTKLGMEYVQLIPVLVNAIKEQQAMIETLEATNASFEARLTALEGGQP